MSCLDNHITLFRRCGWLGAGRRLTGLTFVIPLPSVAHAGVGWEWGSFSPEALALPSVFPPHRPWVLQASFPDAVPAASSIAFKFICCYLASKQAPVGSSKDRPLSPCIPEKDGSDNSSGQVLQGSSAFIKFSYLGA